MLLLELNTIFIECPKRSIASASSV
ncbi:uncharacterized protein METZ01_LOCUS403740, partial [marine metagenome]